MCIRDRADPVPGSDGFQFHIYPMSQVKSVAFVLPSSGSSGDGRVLSDHSKIVTSVLASRERALPSMLSMSTVLPKFGYSLTIAFRNGCHRLIQGFHRR